MSASTTAPPPGLPRAQEVLDFWFGPDPLSPPHFADRLHLWFGGDDPPDLIAERDALVTSRFRPLMDEAAAGGLDHWAGSPRRLLALVLLLDQFPRHVYRGRARAYAQDPRALAFTLHALTTGADATLTLAERLFLYLPLQHAESASIQEESIAAYRRLLADSPPSTASCSSPCSNSPSSTRASSSASAGFPTATRRCHGAPRPRKKSSSTPRQSSGQKKAP